ncbi:hypothetical protein TNCV_2304061 [Trichonephila clavipes]|nr:hypothetical protein TNCV_2304061 [Trichonephila clavipes]
MAVVDFLHHENPPTWAGVGPATLVQKAATNQLHYPVLPESLAPTPRCRGYEMDVTPLVERHPLRLSSSTFCLLSLNVQHYRPII